VAQGVLSWLVAAARRDEFLVVALQYAVRPDVVGRRSAAAHAGPWLDAGMREPRGKPVRPGVPLPAVPRDGPSRVAPLGAPWQVVLLDGLLAQPRPLGRDLFPVGRRCRCSPQSRRYREKMLQCARLAKA